MNAREELRFPFGIQAITESTRVEVFARPTAIACGSHRLILRCAILPPVHYRELRPHPLLRELVRCFWTMEREYTDADGGEMLWPDGKTELIFHYGASYATPLGALPNAFVLGPLSERFALAARGHLRLVAVRFQPWGLTSLFGVPGHELLDIATGADAIDDVRELEERLADANETRAMALLEAFLLRRAARATIDPLTRAIRRVVAQPRTLDVCALAADCNLSTRQLERRFTQATGLPPKRLAVIMRFDGARRALLREPNADPTELALRHGYYDYAHLSRDFRRFLGTTPVDLMHRPPRNVVFVHDGDN